MHIVCLVENTEGVKGLATEHGLSLYIETDTHKILFDVGESDLFMVNAEKLGIDLKAVDLMVLSHGHKDHGGGFKTFMMLNNKARIVMQREAFLKHFSLREGDTVVDISLDPELMANGRITYVDDLFVLDEVLTLFAGVHGNPEALFANRHLRMEKQGAIVQDDFNHELNLLIKEDEKTVLIAGCAHNGIENILEHAERIADRAVTVAVGGFHLQNRSTHQMESSQKLRELADILQLKSTRFWTGHCTGIEAYQELKTLMSDKINYLATGNEIHL